MPNSLPKQSKGSKGKDSGRDNNNRTMRCLTTPFHTTEFEKGPCVDCDHFHYAESEGRIGRCVFRGSPVSYVDAYIRHEGCFKRAGWWRSPGQIGVGYEDGDPSVDDDII